MKVYPGNWKWSEEDPYPGLQSVLDTPFWQHEAYKSLRESLKMPIPNPEVLVGGEFVTIDTLAQRPRPLPQHRLCRRRWRSCCPRRRSMKTLSLMRLPLQPQHHQCERLAWPPSVKMSYQNQKA